MRLFLLVCLFAAVAYAQECGDGVLDEGEACDDGNTFNDDGCTFDCQIEDRFICRDEPSECFPIIPNSCLPPQDRPTEETTTTEDQSTTTGDETTQETTTRTRTTTRTTNGDCPPISCPSDCDFSTHKYRLSRDSEGCQFCRCVLRRQPLDEDDDDGGRDRNRRAISSTEQLTTTEFTTAFPTTTDNPPTTDDGQCPVFPIFITNCTCQSNFRVFWEFVGDCPTCHCVPIEDDQAPPVGDICVGDTTTFGENCTCNEECHACQWDGESGDCLVCTSLFLFRGNCLEACPNGTEAQGDEDFRRRCVVIRTGETTTEATTTGETTTAETTTAETTTAETTTVQTTTAETTTVQTTTAETTTVQTTTAETTTVQTTTAETTTVQTTTAETTTAETTTAESTTTFESTTNESTTDESTTTFESTTDGSTTTFESTTDGSTTGETTTGETTTDESTTIVVPVCNGLPDPLICLNFTLNCTDIIGNITVNETCPVLCSTCNVTTSTVILTTTTAAPAAIIEGAIANNVASASNSANPGLIVGMSVLAVVLVAAAVGLVVHRRRQRRHNNDDEIVVGPPEVRVEEVGGARS